MRKDVFFCVFLCGCEYKMQIMQFFFQNEGILNEASSENKCQYLQGYSIK